MAFSGVRRNWAWLDISKGRISSRINLAPEVMERLSLGEGDPVRARIGAGREGGIVHISAAPANPFARGGRVKVRVSLDEAGRLHLGPLLGIMVGKHHLGNEVQQKLIRAGHRLGVLVFVFVPGAVDLGKKSVKGYTLFRFRKGFRWAPVYLPLPDVIYNRILSRAVEAEPAILRLKNRLRQVPGLKLFNPGFLNKWKLFRDLGRFKEVQRWLPSTELYHAPERLAWFVRRCGGAFLKPVNGRAGSGICEVWRRGEGWVFAFRKGREVIRERYEDLGQLTRRAAEYIGDRPYIIQRRIKLITLGGRKFDIRTLVQKDRSGRWRVTGMGARVAPIGGITTHVPRGGGIAPINRTLTQSLRSRERMKTAKVRLRKLACAVAAAVEAADRRLFGELSMDLGIDRAGRFWVFEANAKPMKFDEKLIQAKGVLRLLHYACFLSGLG